MANESFTRAINPDQYIDKNINNETYFEKVYESKDRVLENFESVSPTNEFKKLNSDGGMDGMYESNKRLQSFKTVVDQKPSTCDPNSIFENSQPKQPEKNTADNRYELSTSQKSQTLID